MRAIRAEASFRTQDSAFWRDMSLPVSHVDYYNVSLAHQESNLSHRIFGRFSNLLTAS